TLTVQDIHKMLSELPELLKVVFNLYEIEGYSHREIAKLLDIGESSSRTYLVRAKKQLRRLALKYLQ
ncbi:MAG: sigma-70 region 4 domain-containing protein, partial [Bacteroidota bacterium]